MTTKVGVIVLNYNSSAPLALCLLSLQRAECDTPYELYLVENGSPENGERERSRELFERYIERGGKGDYIDTGSNLGFAGGNNAAIRPLLERGDITHICLLNADTIVCDRWLDLLITDRAQMTGPVSAACYNAQKLFVRFEPEFSEQAVGLVGDYAARRRELYAGLFQPTEMLEFFCTMFRKDVFERVGLLDERFFPGNFEDDDMSLRVRAAGFEVGIVRELYIHHWGNSSSKNVDEGYRGMIERNRRAFEQKWGAVHHVRYHEFIQSCRIDASHLLENGSAGERELAELLEYALPQTEEIVDEVINAYVVNERFLESETIDGEREIPFSQIKKQLLHKLKRKLKAR